MFFSQEAESLLFVKKEELAKLFTQRITASRNNRKKKDYFSNKKNLVGKAVSLRKNFN
jgi:hypothetical protein